MKITLKELRQIIKEEIRKVSINESTFQKGKTYGGTECKGGCFMGKNGLKKIVDISKQNPKDVFKLYGNTNIVPHYIKNGVIAKANTLGNPSYDLERHKINNLKIGNDVVLAIQLFE